MYKFVKEKRIVHDFKKITQVLNISYLKIHLAGFFDEASEMLCTSASVSDLN